MLCYLVNECRVRWACDLYLYTTLLSTIPVSVITHSPFIILPNNITKDCWCRGVFKDISNVHGHLQISVRMFMFNTLAFTPTPRCICVLDSDQNRFILKGLSLQSNLSLHSLQHFSIKMQNAKTLSLESRDPPLVQLYVLAVCPMSSS